MPTAEIAYLFRHALLRDAAYALQLPSERWRLHALAVQLIEDVFGGRPAASSFRFRAPWEPHLSDSAAFELAHHAGQAAQNDPGFADVHRLYLYRAAKHSEASYRSEESAALWQRLANLLDGADRAACLHFVGIANRFLGRREGAEAAVREAIEIARQAGDRRQECNAMITLGNVCRSLRQHDQALELQRKAIQLARELTDGKAQTTALNSLGGLLREAGDLKSAREAFEQAVEVARAVADPRHEGTALANVASLLSDAGQIVEAEQAYERALGLLRAARDVRAEAIALINQSIMYSVSGRKQQSEGALRASLLILRRVGNHSGEALALSNLGIICRQLGKLEEAERCFERAIAINQETGNRRNVGTALGEQAVLFRETGRAQRALASAQEAVAIHRAERQAVAEAADGCELALCQLVCGMHDQAQATWALAIKALRATGHAYELDQKLAAMRQACTQAGVPAFKEEGS